MKTETTNLRTLTHLLQSRLHSACKSKSADKDGNTIYIATNIYSEDSLHSFIKLSISSFNQMPVFTDFSLSDDKFVRTFIEVLVEGATIYALASQALIERGREFFIGDQGIEFQPPNVSEMLNTQYQTTLHSYNDKLHIIKNQIRDFEV